MLKLIQTSIKLLEQVSPRLAGAFVSQLFMMPKVKKLDTPPPISGMTAERLTYSDHQNRTRSCVVYRGGTGPSVLLLHGWEGSSGSLSTLAESLIQNGYRVILPDLPAHRLSNARKTNIVEISNLIFQLAEREPQLEAVVAHSFGAVAASYAITNGLSPKRLITVSAPTSMKYVVDFFCRVLKVSAGSKKRLINTIESIINADYQSLSMTDAATVFTMPGLIIHDARDRIVPVRHASRLQGQWEGAELYRTSGLGHHRILNDANVISRILRELDGSVTAIAA